MNEKNSPQNLQLISNWHDDTERKKAEEALKESEERYRRLVEFSPYGIAIHSEGKLVYINLAGAKILGTENPDKIVGKMLLQIIHPDYHEIVKNRIRMQEEGKIAPPLEEKFLRLDGTSVDVEIASIPFTYLGKLAMYGVFRDITQRKSAEKQIQASLKEKEILLKEIHHRVNNNMQIISSLLGLQSISSKDKKVAEMFRISQNIINSMSLIHEKLYRSKDLTKIELNDYIRDLTNSLSMSRGIAGRIELILNIETISLGIDHAIPCGLIVNELITNSLKHAFPGDRNGEIKVSAHREDENMIKLIFSDNGVGIPSNIDFRNTQSLGLHLVTILVQDQLNGKIDLDRTGGTEFKIIFKG